MSDDDGNIIPLVDGDQGEGIKDFIEDFSEKLDSCRPPTSKTFFPDGKNTKEMKPVDLPKEIEILNKVHKLELKINRILIHLGIDDKSEILQL